MVNNSRTIEDIKPLSDKELFYLRKSNIECKYSKNKLVILINRLFADTTNLPLVVGNSNWDEKGWSISFLNPHTPSDEITVKNFLEGFKNLDKYIRENKDLKHVNDVNYRLYINGVDNMHYSNQDTDFINLFISLHQESYALQLFWRGSKFYNAKASKEKSFFEEKMNPHIGPKQEYIRTLL